MGKIACADDGDPFFLGPKGEVFRVHGPGRGPGKVGVDVKISDEFHDPDIWKLKKPAL